ncbi:MAG: hypothetical protein R2684_09575 [Pyrinomonadaceae bacterium]
MSNFLLPAIALAAILGAACGLSILSGAPAQTRKSPTPLPTPVTTKNPDTVVHVIVALCDNENQGIVPVPAKLGNGEDPSRNLYWGAAFGVKTYFSKSSSWTSLGELKAPKDEILERIAFRHKKTGALLVADAYRGADIKTAIEDYFSFAAGSGAEPIVVGEKEYVLGAGAKYIAYIGHNGLMDFDLSAPKSIPASRERKGIVLACYSGKYFGKALKDTETAPLLVTRQFMAPEAYSLHDALESSLDGKSDEAAFEAAAAAYARYQRISVKAAKGVFSNSWN